MISEVDMTIVNPPGDSTSFCVWLVVCACLICVYVVFLCMLLYGLPIVSYDVLLVHVWLFVGLFVSVVFVVFEELSDVLNNIIT